MNQSNVLSYVHQFEQILVEDNAQFQDALAAGLYVAAVSANNMGMTKTVFLKNCEIGIIIGQLISEHILMRFIAKKQLRCSLSTMEALQLYPWQTPGLLSLMSFGKRHRWLCRLFSKVIIALKHSNNKINNYVLCTYRSYN